MNPYRLDIQSEARRTLQRLDRRLRQDISEIILDLRDEPHPLDSSPLTRELQGRRKIKVNGWRIIYSVNETDKVVTIWSIRKRGPDTYLNVP